MAGERRTILHAGFLTVTSASSLDKCSDSAVGLITAESKGTWVVVE
jgi:hypothetical protein